MDLTHRYTALLLSLMPRGVIWQRMGCSSWFKQLLEAFAEEYARFHVWLVLFIESTIKNHAREPHGWSCTDYENLLKTKFGVDAEVTDNQCIPLHTDSIYAGSYVYSRPYQYLITISVNDISVLTDEIKNYLETYKQSHTAFCFREYPHWRTDLDVQQLNVDNFNVGSPIYAKDWHIVTLLAHTSWNVFDIARITPLNDKRDYTIIKREYPAYAPH